MLDLTAGRPPDPVALFIPAHVAFRVQILGDTVTVSGLDYGWFLHEIEQGRLTKLRPALDNRQTVVLTADTAGLRAWLAAQARDSEVFGDATRFVRKTRQSKANFMSCSASSCPASEISGGFHAAAPASAR